METCIATSNVPTSQYKMYHDNVPCGKQIYRYGGLRPSLHQGRENHISVDTEEQTEWRFVLASFIFIKKKINKKPGI